MHAHRPVCLWFVFPCGSQRAGRDERRGPPPCGGGPLRFARRAGRVGGAAKRARSMRAGCGPSPVPALQLVAACGSRPLPAPALQLAAACGSRPLAAFFGFDQNLSWISFQKWLFGHSVASFFGFDQIEGRHLVKTEKSCHGRARKGGLKCETARDFGQNRKKLPGGWRLAAARRRSAARRAPRPRRCAPRPRPAHASALRACVRICAAGAPRTFGARAVRGRAAARGPPLASCCCRHPRSYATMTRTVHVEGKARRLCTTSLRARATGPA